MIKNSKIRCFISVGLWTVAFGVLTACSSDDPIADSSQQPDPTVSDYALAYIQRPAPTDEDGNPVMENVNEPDAFNPGAVLLLKDRALPSAATRDISSRAFIDPNDPDTVPLYDVKDLSISPDGTKLVFAMRAPEIPNADELDQPKWNIWQYELETDELTRVITSNIVAEDGHDVMPSYLPDGRIVFSSSRQRKAKAILLDEGKPQFSGLEEDLDVHAFVLHTMEEDGSNLKQITFNHSHDMYPTLLIDGRIAFLRWDKMGAANAVSLYTVHPDGQNLQRLYGYHSQRTGNGGAQAYFTRPRAMPNGDLLVLSKPEQSLSYGGDPVVINHLDFIEADAMLDGTAGEGQRSIAADIVNTDDTPSPSGLYHSVSPLWDDTGDSRVLMSWSPCQLREVDPDTMEETLYPCIDEYLQRYLDGELLNARPSYSVWIWNRNNNTQSPVAIAQPGTWLTDPVIFQRRLIGLQFIPDGIPGIDLDQDLVTDNVGVLNIRSVYDFDGVDTTEFGIRTMADPVMTPPETRPARFLRVVKGVSIPDEDTYDFDNSAFGRSRQQLMREILGYVPIEPDGSVVVKVPANVPFAISVLDENGQRISGRHQNWLQLQLGEVKTCNGCHTRQSEVAHGRADADPDSAYLGSIGNTTFPNSNPTLFADDGETMAEAYTRQNGIPEPSLDVTFTDIWTDDTVATPASDINLLYADLTTTPPISSACQVSWYAGCRITINFEEHIQPIFNLDRPVFDAMGNQIADNTCTSCHSLFDTVNNVVQAPAGQLELTDLASPDEPLHYRSYRELFFNDNAVEVVDGAVVEQQEPIVINGQFIYQTIDANGLVIFFLDDDGLFVTEPDPITGLPTEMTDTDGTPIYQTDAQGNPLFETDADGNLILDQNGNPIPLPIALPVPEPNQLTQPIPVTPILNTAGANASSEFFQLFRGGTHDGRLTDAELRLIAEWLDIGGQYFNNPFLAPEN
ncbi:MAG: PD40 domain-containing protein [Gammaproteobacteria bacterium]|nr:PD40 domain-containing protein [Gammaproteobacteria bacterium]